MTHPEIVKLASKYGKDAGQVILRFEYQEGIIIFPKSIHESRIKSNMEIFDFALTDAEMDALRALDTDKGIHDPVRPGVKEMLLGAFDVHANV
ncbi:MAG: aldo/keto reductase [Selenomonas sp.]|nr:aldo/keto reductase [Selenomonas sp.]